MPGAALAENQPAAVGAQASAARRRRRRDGGDQPKDGTAQDGPDAEAPTHAPKGYEPAVLAGLLRRGVTRPAQLPARQHIPEPGRSIPGIRHQELSQRIEYRAVDVLDMPGQRISLSGLRIP